MKNAEKLTLLLAVSYISPSTFRAYATRLTILLSLRAFGSFTGVGNIAVTLKIQYKILKNYFKISKFTNLLTVFEQDGFSNQQ